MKNIVKNCLCTFIH